MRAVTSASVAWREVGGFHLLAQKFQVDKTIQNRAAVVVGKLREGSVGEQSFVAQGFVPVALQDDAAVHGGDDAVDDLGRAVRRREQKGPSTSASAVRVIVRLVRNLIKMAALY